MDSLSRRQESLVVVTLLLTSLAHVLDFVVMMPLGPQLMSEFGMSVSLFGKIVSVYTFAAALSSLLSTAWIDRINRKTTMLLLLFGFTIGNALCAWAPNVSVLIVGRLVAGAFGGVMTAVVYAIIGQSISVGRRGRAAGILGTSFPLVSILGVPLALRAADFFGWRAAFYLVLGASAVATLMTILALPRIAPAAHGGNTSALAPLRRVLKHPPHRWGMVLMVASVFGGFTMVPYIAPFLINNSYIRADQLYLVYLIGGSFSIFSSRIIGGLADRFGKVRMLRWMLVLTMAALLVFTNLPFHSLGLILLTTTLTMMFLPGRFVCVMALLTLLAREDDRGTYMSAVSTVQQATIGLASMLGGYLVGESSTGRLDSFWLVGAFCIACNALVLVALTPRLGRLEKASVGV